MGLSVNEFIYSGDEYFDLNFALGYSSTQDVTCYVVRTGNTVSLDFDWVSQNRVRLASGHDLVNGEEVVFRRTVSKTTLPVDLTVEGEVTRENLEAAILHNTYIMHELFDERTADVHPWEAVGNLDLLNYLWSFDYLATYINERDAT